MSRRTLSCALLAVAVMAAAALYQWVAHHPHGAPLNARLAQIVAPGKHAQIPCAELAATRPLVLLALGQSNAGNHGAPSARAAAPVTLIAEGKCLTAADPLPGATGTGGSIWQRLPALLSAPLDARPVVLSVLAVDATSIADWTEAQSPLRERLAAQVAAMHRLGLAPALVLWQQGEADARDGTSEADYAAGLGRLAAALSEAGTNAPIVLARSTICQSAPNSAIRNAIEASVANDRRFRLGPDTDTLSSDAFRTGCHLTADGLDSAAKMWAATISSEASTIRPAPWPNKENASGSSPVGFDH